MKQVDFGSGKISHCILTTAMPLLLAQVLNLLYNIVDRIYIARIADVGTAALGAVGIFFPMVSIISAFASLYGGGGSPLFAIERGKKDDEAASLIMRLSFFMIVVTSVILMAVCLVFAPQILRLLGASDAAMVYVLPYMRIYMCGTFFAMVAVGMNPFINAQGYPKMGMLTVLIGAAANIILDPLFIFVFGMGVKGAAIATVISQCISAVFVLVFLCTKAQLRLKMPRMAEIKGSLRTIGRIVSLGMASFVMLVSNSLVTICCNQMLGRLGGDLYISVMTIMSSIRQIIELPLTSFSDGTSPLISYNYGAGRMDRVRQSVAWLFGLGMLYAVLMWAAVMAFPGLFVSIFSTDAELLADAAPAARIYFAAFFFMVFQHTGQTTFKALGRNRQAIFFSVFRKIIIVIPLTLLLPTVFGMGTAGVFAAEPVSNVIGGMACFLTMLLTVGKEFLPRKGAVRPENHG